MRTKLPTEPGDQKARVSLLRSMDLPTLSGDLRQMEKGEGGGEGERERKRQRKRERGLAYHIG